MRPQKRRKRNTPPSHHGSVKQYCFKVENFKPKKQRKGRTYFIIRKIHPILFRVDYSFIDVRNRITLTFYQPVYVPSN